MKYLPQDQHIKTSCKNCAFAVYDGKTQKSCSFDRIGHFGDSIVEAYDDQKEFYIINKFCNYYRDKAWGYSEADKEKTKKESALSFDVVFDCSNLSQEKIQNIIHSINSIDYYDKKVNFILLQLKINDRYDDINKEIIDIYPKLKRAVTVSICDSMSSFMHQLLLKTKHTYHVFVKTNNQFDNNSLYTANDLVNKELKKFLIADIGSDRVIRNLAYRSFYNFHNTVNYFENTDSILGCSKGTEAYIEI
jgi:hypothetical protein